MAVRHSWLAGTKLVCKRAGQRACLVQCDPVVTVAAGKTDILNFSLILELQTKTNSKLVFLCSKKLSQILCKLNKR